MQAMEPSRSLLFQNGAALGVFPAEEDAGGRRRSVVVLEPSGHCFTHMRQDGGYHRQLSDFCRRDLVPFVAAVSRFRNAHSGRPHVCRRIHSASAQQENGAAVAGGSNSRRRRRRAPSRFAQWPVAAAAAGRGEGGAAARSPDDPHTAHTVAVRGDGAVEVRAVGGNARLTLSASRALAEVDYAVALPNPGDNGHEGGEIGGRGSSWRDAGGGGGAAAFEAEASTHPAAAAAQGGFDAEGRTWVTRQFLIDPAARRDGDDGVPPEFSHPLALALGAAAGARSDEHGVGGAPDGGVAGGVGKGFVLSELPRPEDRPEHASWDTVQAPALFDDRHLAPLGYSSDWRNARRGATAAGLLSVDLMKLAEGRGFAGGLAAVVESTGSCTYRVVFDGAAEGRGGEGVGVHVVVHADGTEVWLEGDFVHLVRPPSAAPAHQRRRLLHASAASTVHFSVWRPPPSPCPSSRQPADSYSAPATGSPSSPPGSSAPATAGSGGWASVSLGDIASRALALRRQFVAAQAMQQRQQPPHIKIKPPTLTMPGGGGSLPPGASRTARPAPRGVPPPTTATANTQRGRPTTAPAGGGREKEGGKGATVLESVERGGASFVAFADGRARGAFPDRTIVTLGAPPRRPGFDGGDGALWEGREVECIHPDGTVVRRTGWSLGGHPRGCVVAAAAAAADVNSNAIPVPAAFRPYVSAVVRFARWAAASPAERRAAAERAVAGGAAAAAEADRNRRFVDLQRVVRLAAMTPPPSTQQLQPSNAAASGGEAGGSSMEPRSGGGGGALAWDGTVGERSACTGNTRNQENMPAYTTTTVSGEGKNRLAAGAGRGPPRGPRERNALVSRLLDANREVLLGARAPRVVR